MPPTAIIAAAIVAAIVIIAAVLYVKRKNPPASPAPAMPPATPPAAPPAMPDPPTGGMILVENLAALKAAWKPGQAWPTTPPAACGESGLPYLLVTPLCAGGNEPGLINGGSGKCTDKASNTWTGCVNATS